MIVDGVPVPADDPRTGQINLVNLPPVPIIYGIEVFAAGSAVPREFASTVSQKSCGLIAIWTK